MVPKVDTFALDISEEIKRKEATLSDIATASNEIGNTPEEGGTTVVKNNSKIFFIIIALFVAGILGLIGFIFYYFILNTKEIAPIPVTETQVPAKKATDLSSLSTTLNQNIGIHITSVEKRDKGYVLTIASYSPVFAYITRNEEDFIEELVASINPTPNVAPKKETSAQATSTQTGTTTQSTSTPSLASTTVATSTEEKDEVVQRFNNVTMSNVNMRIFTEGERSVVYSFVSTEKLIIAPTKEDVLAIKSVILR